MTKTIIHAIVSILCTAAICITAVVCVNNYKKDNASAVASSDYITEAQAADYLGISESRLVILRQNLKYLEGSYIVYAYTNDKGEDVSVCMYSKTDLKKAVSEIMSDSSKNKINFKYLEEAIEKANSEAK